MSDVRADLREVEAEVSRLLAIGYWLLAIGYWLLAKHFRPKTEIGHTIKIKRTGGEIFLRSRMV